MALTLEITTLLPEQGPKTAHFDRYAENYDAALNQGLSLTGEGRDYFARERILWLCRCLQKISLRPRRILDYGCGTGCTIPLFLELLGPDSVVGVDTSTRSLQVARQTQPKRYELFSDTEYKPKGEVDLVYCNGVFHHIPPAERAAALSYIAKCLCPGGLFAFWENNPWNPGTRYVMSRIPVGRDAIALPPYGARKLLRKSGFQILRSDFLFFFPRFLKSLRWIEPTLSGLPLGGQYQILCQRSP